MRVFESPTKYLSFPLSAPEMHSGDTVISKEERAEIWSQQPKNNNKYSFLMKMQIASVPHSLRSPSFPTSFAKIFTGA